MFNVRVCAVPLTDIEPLDSSLAREVHELEGTLREVSEEVKAARVRNRDAIPAATKAALEARYLALSGGLDSTTEDERGATAGSKRTRRATSAGPTTSLSVREIMGGCCFCRLHCCPSHTFCSLRSADISRAAAQDISECVSVQQIPVESVISDLASTLSVVRIWGVQSSVEVGSS